MHTKPAKSNGAGMGLSLAGLVLVAILPLLVFAGGVAWLIIDQKKIAVTDELASTTRALRVAVDRELLSQFTAMEILASDASLDTGNLTAFHDRARRAIETHGAWLNAVLIDPHSHTIVASGLPMPTPAPTTSSPAGVDEVVKTRKPMVAGLVAKGKIMQEPIVLFLSPVVRGNEVRYVLAVVMDPQPLNSVFTEQRLNESWTGAILDNHLTLAGRSRAPEKYIGVRATPTLADRILANESGMFTALNQEGVTVYTVFSRSPVTGWSVAIGVPADEVEGPIHRMLLQLALAGGALMVFALILAAMVGRGITRRRNLYETALSNSRTRLQESLKEFNDLVDRIPVGVFKGRTLKAGGYRCDFLSPLCCKLLGVSAEAVYADAQIAFSSIHPDDREDFFVKLAMSCEQLLSIAWEGRFLKGEQVRWLHLRSSPTRLDNGDILWEGILSDITQRKRLETELREMATTDILTGLPNRRHFMARLEEEQARVLRLERQSAVVLMLDLDNFKHVNDTYGHATGDGMLKHFAGLMREGLRKIDMGGRVGGEEFAIILPGADLTAAQAFAERLRRKVAETPFLQEGRIIPLTVSIGIAAITPEDATPDDALMRADEALYRAKKAGRNRVEISL